LKKPGSQPGFFMSHMLRKFLFCFQRLKPSLLAAEALICEKFFGMDRVEAIGVLKRVKTADDFKDVKPQNPRTQ
jgi:hypothetical protein